MILNSQVMWCETDYISNNIELIISILYNLIIYVTSNKSIKYSLYSISFTRKLEGKGQIELNKK